MKKLATLTACGTFAAGALLLSPPAFAIPSEHLNWGQNLAATDTACPAGQGIVNVNQKVINDVD